VEDFMHDTTFV